MNVPASSEAFVESPTAPLLEEKERAEIASKGEEAMTSYEAAVSALEKAKESPQPVSSFVDGGKLIIQPEILNLYLTDERFAPLRDTFNEKLDAMDKDYGELKTSEKYKNMPPWMQDSYDRVHKRLEEYWTYTQMKSALEKIEDTVGVDSIKNLEMPLKVLSEKYVDSSSDTTVEAIAEIRDGRYVMPDAKNVFKFDIRTIPIDISKPEITPEEQRRFEEYLAIKGIVFGIDRNPPFKNFDENPDFDTRTLPLLVESNMSPDNETLKDAHGIGCVLMRFREDTNSEGKDIQIMRVTMNADLRGNGTGPILMAESLMLLAQGEHLPNLEFDPENPPRVFLDARYGSEDRTNFYERTDFIFAGDVPPIDNKGFWNIRMYGVLDIDKFKERCPEYEGYIKPLANQYIALKDRVKDMELSQEEREVSDKEAAEVAARMKKIWDEDVKNIFEEIRKEEWAKVRSGELNLREKFVEKEEAYKREKARRNKASQT